MGAVIESAVNWAVKIADDNSHGYDQSSRWGVDYDCSSLVISAFEQAGVKVKTGGATYTGNMRSVFLKYGFQDVTNQITLSSGAGLKRGDVLLNTTHHTALVVTDGGKTIVNASINENGKATGGKKGDQTGREIYTRGYYNYPWNCVLRYTGDDSVAPSASAASTGQTTTEQKEYSLSDKYGTGGVSVREDFSLSRDETHKLLADGVDISSYAGGLSWQNSIDELSTKLTFSVAKSDTRYVNPYMPICGSIINLYTNAEIFRGIVISVDDGAANSNTYTVCDFGWYLNKSKETYQFNHMTAYKAITKMCADFNIPIDSIPQLEKEIKQIYVDKTISDIIADILNLCGGNYNYDVTPRGLRIYKFGELYAYPEFRITPNTQLLYSPSLRGGISHSVSIEEMKNSIKVISEADSVYTVQTLLRDNDSIAKYGFLQEVVKIDTEKENAAEVAKEQFEALSQPTETYSAEIIEAVDSYTRAGEIIVIDDVEYLIESTDHSITNGVHHNSLSLIKWQGSYREAKPEQTAVTASASSSATAENEAAWVTGHTATTYGYNGDDNGICGWNGLNYHNISGCHVAIPTYCVKQASCYNSAYALADYPELANGYGTVLEVRAPDTGKSCRAVVADCGNFGKHNTYNHDTALDLPPNTFNALGLGHGTYAIEYRVVGSVSKWDGNQI